MPTADLPDKFASGELGDLIFRSGFRGIFYGGCIERKEGSSFRRKAHAHLARGKKARNYEGWICYRSAKRLRQINLLIHELAHIVSNEGHTDKFRQTEKQIRKLANNPA